MSDLIALPAAQRFAEVWLALTRADDVKIQVSAALARKALIKLTVKHQKQIEGYWDAANKESLRLLVLVMENNPKKSRGEILKRPDVAAILREPYLEAAAKSEELLHKAWNEAEKDALQKTKAEFKLLGEGWKGHDLDPALLDALVGDLHANAKAMRKRYREAVRGDQTTAKDRLRVVARDASRRAGYSLSTAVWGVSTQVRDSAIDRAGLNKAWVAVLDDKTCSHCKALHGKIIGPKEQFPLDAGDTMLRAYRNSLYGPPRHPNCRCVLVPTKLKKN